MQSMLLHRDVPGKCAQYNIPVIPVAKTRYTNSVPTLMAKQERADGYQ